MKIPLIKPTITEDDLQSSINAVYSEEFSDGKVTRYFEKMMADFLCIEGSIATNSCTSAIILALSTLGLKPHDEVIIPTYTCISILNAVIQFGVTPKLADIDIQPKKMNYNICLNSIEKILSAKTKAIIVPHMFGVSAQMDMIAAFNIPVIEDITLSFGAKYKGKPLGAWGTVCVCSFHSSKLISCGEGGMLGSKDRTILDRARYLNSWEKELVDFRIGNKKTKRYELRYNFHLSGVLASLGLSQLKKTNNFIERRRSIAEIYSTHFHALKYLKIPIPEYNQQNIYQRYLLMIENANIIEIINRFYDYGIEVGRGVYPPLHQMLGLDSNKFPNSEHAVKTILSIPIYPSLNESDVYYIIESCRKIFKAIKK